MVYPVARVLQQPRDIHDVRLIGVIAVRRLSGDRRGVGERRGWDERCLIGGVAYHPITACKLSNGG